MLSSYNGLGIQVHMQQISHQDVSNPLKACQQD